MRPIARSLLVIVVLAAASACARTGAATPSALPDTPAGRALRAWLDAYDSADSVRLAAYAGQYEPAMSVHEQMVFRRQTGPWTIASIERSEPLHVEVVLESRADSTVGFVPITMYAALDAIDGAPPRASSTLAFIGRGARLRLPRIDAGHRATAIDSVIAKMVRNYVFLDVAHEIADSLRARQARGAYDEYGTEVGFALRLNRDLRALAGDRQAGVEYAWRLPLPPAPPVSPAMIHCGVGPAGLLGGTLGYVKLYSFGASDIVCGHEIANAISSVADAPALILDLRDAGEDLPDSRTSMAFVASYLVAACTHLGDVVDRRTARTEELWTRDGLPGRPFGGAKPLYILTSARTFAAAEELAYDLQSLGRAVVVGERTAGGAHVTAVGPVGAHMLVHVPIARAINPVTRTNWARRGVQPDVVVSASEALATTRRLIEEGRTPRTSLASTAPRESAPPVGSGDTQTTARLRPLRGVRFAIDTVVSYAAWRGMLSRVAGTVEFAQGRGRLDVTGVAHAPAISVDGVTITEPLARPGDYYLFDNAGFILVHPATRTFASVAFSRAEFNHTGAILPGAFLMGRNTIARVDTLAAGDAVARQQHGPVGIQWHMQPRGGPPPGGVWNLYARGWLEIVDAPAVEAGVARWFEVAAALATRADGVPRLPEGGLEVTSMTLLHSPGTRGPPLTYGEMLTAWHLANVDVDPSRLVLPPGFTETQWPGFERSAPAPAPSGTAARRWRALESVASQRTRAACGYAWLPEGAGGASADTSTTARPLDVRRGLR